MDLDVQQSFTVSILKMEGVGAVDKIKCYYLLLLISLG